MPLSPPHHPAQPCDTGSVEGNPRCTNPFLYTVESIVLQGPCPTAACAVWGLELFLSPPVLPALPRLKPPELLPGPVPGIRQ